MLTSSKATIDDGSSYPRFLVIQHGARHGYAVPLAFDRMSALTAVYTDIIATRGIGSLLSLLTPSGGANADALLRRTPPRELIAKIHAFGGTQIAGGAWGLITTKNSGIKFGKHLLERAMISRGTLGATHIYTMLGEGGRFIKRARESGLGVVGDVYIALSADRIVEEEARIFPDWDYDAMWRLKNDEKGEHNSVLLSQSDLLVCPSEFVRDDLIQHHGVDPIRTMVSPYAVSLKWQYLPVNPEPGRILFAGTANLRKGIHYLARAATLLKNTCQVRVAGIVPEIVRNHPAAADLHFLGHLGQGAMAAEFARADVFVFPSLAEGSAGVTAEALGAGVPVVTTKAAGSIVRDGIDGIIVPERNPHLLAEAVETIVADRDRRAAMSSAARARARAYTWDTFALNVISATRQIGG